MTPEEFERRLREWKEAERAAIQAEEAVKRIGQGASDPRISEVYANARELRRKADTLIADLIRQHRQAANEVLRRQA